ncbi:MAG: hypothetical protein KKF88_01625 [Alphaproteobacteria bacterium]|nr:hypothetical protein [Alphaproteobacteria bacterium]
MTDSVFRIRQQAGEPLVFLILNPNIASVGDEALRLHREAEAEYAHEGPLVRSHPVWNDLRDLFANAAERHLAASDVGEWVRDRGEQVQVDASRVFDREPLRLIMIDRETAALFKLTWL